MRIVKHDVGHNRWHLSGYSTGHNEDILFQAWMQENHPDCMCIKRRGDGFAHWEIRGTDITHMMMIAMRWS